MLLAGWFFIASLNGYFSTVVGPFTKQEYCQVASKTVDTTTDYMEVTTCFEVK